MKRILVLLLIVAFAAGVLWPVEAGHKQVVVQKQVVVASPIAIPVGVPVAPYGGVYYEQTNKAAAPPPKSSEEIFADKVLAIIEAKQAGNVNALGKVTVFGSKCAQCHATGNEELGKPQFTNIAAMPTDLIVQCVDSVLNDRMPKGSNLSPQEAGELLKEFNAELMVRMSESVPPVPEP